MKPQQPAAACCGGSVCRHIIGRYATGSPQPPPGGGLHLRVLQVRSCRPTARLRAFFAQNRSRRDRQAAFVNVSCCKLDVADVGGPQPPGGGGPLFVAEHARPPQAAARPKMHTKTYTANRLLNAEFAVPIGNRIGPQLRPAKARSSRPLEQALRKLQPGIEFFTLNASS